MTWIFSVHTLLLNNKIHECDNVDMALAQSVYEANSFYINLTSSFKQLGMVQGTYLNCC